MKKNILFLMVITLLLSFSTACNSNKITVSSSISENISEEKSYLEFSIPDNYQPKRIELPSVPEYQQYIEFTNPDIKKYILEKESSYSFPNDITQYKNFIYYYERNKTNDKSKKVIRYNLDTKENEIVYEGDYSMDCFYVMNESTLLFKPTYYKDEWYIYTASDKNIIPVSEKTGIEGTVVSAFENGFIYAEESIYDPDTPEIGQRFIFYENEKITRDFTTSILGEDHRKFWGFGANLFLYNTEEKSIELLNEHLREPIPFISGGDSFFLYGSEEKLQEVSGNLYWCYSNNVGNDYITIYIDLYNQCIFSSVSVKNTTYPSLNKNGILLNSVAVSTSTLWKFETPLLQFDISGNLSYAYLQNGSKTQNVDPIMYNDEIYLVGWSDDDDLYTMRILSPVAIDELDPEISEYVRRVQDGYIE